MFVIHRAFLSAKETDTMAKSQPTGTAHRKSKSGNFSVTSDRTGRVIGPLRSKGTRREILFPTEPTSIPHEQIDRAIEAVMSRKK
jgi:hypothetical protein